MIDGLDPFHLSLLAGSRRRAYAVSEAYVSTPGNVAYPPGVVTDRDKRDWLTNGGHRDAFRHAYRNASMARDLGQDWTERSATAREAVPGTSRRWTCTTTPSAVGLPPSIQGPAMRLSPVA